MQQCNFYHYSTLFLLYWRCWFSQYIQFNFLVSLLFHQNSSKQQQQQRMTIWLKSKEIFYILFFLQHFTKLESMKNCVMSLSRLNAQAKHFIYCLLPLTLLLAYNFTINTISHRNINPLFLSLYLFDEKWMCVLTACLVCDKITRQHGINQIKTTTTAKKRRRKFFNNARAFLHVYTIDIFLCISFSGKRE